MTTREMFSKERVNFDLKASNKDEVLNELIDILVADGKVTDKEKFKDAVLKRKKSSQQE